MSESLPEAKPDKLERYPFLDTPDQLKFELARYEFMRAGQEILAKSDPKRPKTLALSVEILITAAGATPAELSKASGHSQTTIGRWRNQQTIPRSTPFREWTVGEFKKLLDQKISAQSAILSIHNG